MKNARKGRVIVLMLILSLLVLPFVTRQPVKTSRAMTTVTDVTQLDAGVAVFGEGTEEKESHYVTIGWKGTAAYYSLYQIMGDKSEEKPLGVIAPEPVETPAPTATPTATPKATEKPAATPTATPAASATPTGSPAVSATPTVAPTATEKPTSSGLYNFVVNINGLEPGLSLNFKIYESDSAGKKINSNETGVLVEGVKTTPAKLDAPKLIKIYQNINDSDFSFRPDAFSEGFQIRAETIKGKKLYVKNLDSAAVSGSAAARFSLKPCYPGKIVCVKVRGFVKIGNGTKKYGEWSDTVEYGYAKKIKLSGKKDSIKISGIKVEGASKKEIYVSTKKNKGYKFAKKIGAKTTSTKISKFGKKYVQSKKTYYVRIYYYYKVGKKTKKSPVYDQDMVFVKPAISYIKVE